MPAKTPWTSPPRIDAATVALRNPTPEDAAAIHGLVVRSGVLDANSVYCYLLLCSDFADTSLVATCDEQVVGFALAYRPPVRSETLFVWQIGVEAAARGCGLGSRLIGAILQLPACEHVTFLEATITPSNTASRRLFERFAKSQRLDCTFDTSAGFPASLFGTAGHEQEDRVRIGPLAGLGETAAP